MRMAMCEYMCECVVFLFAASVILPRGRFLISSFRSFLVFLLTCPKIKTLLHHHHQTHF